jgi:hypothetical protein
MKNIILYSLGVLAPTALFLALHAVPRSPLLRVAPAPMAGQPLTSTDSPADRKPVEATGF